MHVLSIIRLQSQMALEKTACVGMQKTVTIDEGNKEDAGASEQLGFLHVWIDWSWYTIGRGSSLPLLSGAWRRRQAIAKQR